MKLCTIIGARPQFIKAAAVSRAIADYNRLTPHSSPLTEVIVHTGQHYDYGMSEVFFRELEIPEPAYNLEVGSRSQGTQTGLMLARIEEVLVKEQPDRVLVYGDTNSTLAGALAAAKLHIPVAHVEAGLRSFNRRMPEEINRVVTDHLATLLFCPSETAVSNLKAEGINGGVHVIGDVMGDALKFALSSPLINTGLLSRLGLKEKAYLLATVHRPENTDDPDRLGNIMVSLSELAEREAVVLPLHPRTRKILDDNFSLRLTPYSSLKIIDPVGYFDILTLERSARTILTDSGGMQKEAYWLSDMKKMKNDPEMLEEYDFRGGARGKYAKRYAEGTNVVVIDPDVAEYFPDHESVNDALRSLAAIIRRKRKAEQRHEGGPSIG